MPEKHNSQYGPVWKQLGLKAELTGLNYCCRRTGSRAGAAGEAHCNKLAIPKLGPGTGDCNLGFCQLCNLHVSNCSLGNSPGRRKTAGCRAELVSGVDGEGTASQAPKHRTQDLHQARRPVGRGQEEEPHFYLWTTYLTFSPTTLLPTISVGSFEEISHSAVIHSGQGGFHTCSHGSDLVKSLRPA